jgi:predicted HTH transcriptional regulator
MTDEEFLQIIGDQQESRHREFKGSHAWTDSAFKAKLIKSILAFSNTRDGGWIVIGVREDGDYFRLDGMTSDDVNTYDQDTVAAAVAAHADPFVVVDITKKNYDGKDFVVIRIAEFEHVPVICKKAGESNLRRGAIYIRTRRIPESAEVPTQTEMREILDLAAEKELRKFLQRLERAGGSLSSAELQREYDDELKDLL